MHVQMIYLLRMAQQLVSMNGLNKRKAQRMLELQLEQGMQAVPEHHQEQAQGNLRSLKNKIPDALRHAQFGLRKRFLMSKIDGDGLWKPSR